MDVSTLREPYRLEGMKTMGYELAEQLGGRLPSAIVYPTGGGEGTVGIWKAIGEMRAWGWVPADAPLPRMVVAQAAGCAPIVRAFAAGATARSPGRIPPRTRAACASRARSAIGCCCGCCARARGTPFAIDDATTRDATTALSHATGIDAAPEGGCALAAVERLVRDGRIGAADDVVVFNTGSGASYRRDGE
jgi:threonine synthase